MYSFFADLVVIVHFIFILFVVLGALLVIRWHGIIYLHLIALVWGVSIEIGGWICPLTPLEQWLRSQAGIHQVYQSGFIEKYLLPLIYPEGLTREIQYLLALIVIVINLVLYGYLFFRKSGLQKKPHT